MYARCGAATDFLFIFIEEYKFNTSLPSKGSVCRVATARVLFHLSAVAVHCSGWRTYSCSYPCAWCGGVGTTLLSVLGRAGGEGYVSGATMPCASPRVLFRLRRVYVHYVR